MRVVVLLEGVPAARRLAEALATDGQSVRIARDVDDLWALAEAMDVDCFLVGASQGGTLGPNLCRRLRERSSAPIIAVTDQESEMASVLSLELGADDYVTLSVSVADLMARVRAVARRARTPTPPAPPTTRVLAAGDITVDLDAHEVTVGGRAVALPPKEFDLLAVLVENSGRVVPRQRLLDIVWGDCDTDTKTLGVHIQRLRARLGGDRGGRERVLTLRGVGYKLQPGVAMDATTGPEERSTIVPLHVSRGLPPAFRRSSELLHREFTGIYSRETIDRVVGEALDALSASATLHTFVPLLVERSARLRLRSAARLEEIGTGAVPEVLFVCVHNSGRSRMAERFLQHHAGGRIHGLSVGSDPADHLNPVVVAAMLERGLDIREGTTMPLTENAVRAADVVITMGCGDACPVYPGKVYRDWELGDPMEKTIDEVRTIRDSIEKLVTQLIGDLTGNLASCS